MSPQTVDVHSPRRLSLPCEPFRPCIIFEQVRLVRRDNSTHVDLQPDGSVALQKPHKVAAQLFCSGCSCGKLRRGGAKSATHCRVALKRGSIPGLRQYTHTVSVFAGVCKLHAYRDRGVGDVAPTEVPEPRSSTTPLDSSPTLVIPFNNSA